MEKFTHDEMRAIRRERINSLLHQGVKRQGMIKRMVRYWERKTFSTELKAYA